MSAVRGSWGHARKASFVWSDERRRPSVASAPSTAKVAEASKDLERLLLRFEQGGRVGADAEEGVGPFGTRRALGVEAECGRGEEDALGLHFLDYRPLGEDGFEGLPGQPGRTNVLRMLTF